MYLPVTQAVPCALVLNELISNSLKHAYRDGEQGTISISMQQSDDDTILMRVRDNGAGIPEEIDIGRTKSLGLKLARNIVNKQLNGKIKIIRNKGTEFIVEFKNWHIYMSPVVIISWLLRSFSPIIETLLSTGPPAIACSNNRIISRMAILCRLLLLESSRYAYSRIQRRTHEKTNGSR